MQSKDLLIQMLQQLSTYMHMMDENPFKVKAFEKASGLLEETTESLEDIAAGKVKVPGIGEGIKAILAEFLSTGKIDALEKMKAQIPESVFEMTKLSGISAKKAMLLFKELSIQSIGELEYACQENRLVELKGFGAATQNKIMKSIEEYKNHLGKLRIDQALDLHESLSKEILKIDPKAEIFKAGECARFNEIVQILEMAVVSQKAKKLQDHFNAVKSEAEGKSLLSFQNEEGIEVRLWMFMQTPDDITLNWLAAAPEWKEKIQNKEYLTWEKSWFEPEWKNRKPTTKTYRIKTNGTVKGIFHCHTTLSDGTNSLEEMVVAAQAKGYQYIGISDHSQSAFYARGLKPNALEEQMDAIKKLQKRSKIKIFHGVESDILSEGSLDYTDSLLKELDFVVGSIHSRFQMNESEMTARLTNAFAQKWMTFWGHPTGRLILSRKPYALDWKQCLDTIQKNQVCVEINAHPYRLDMDWRLGEEIEKRNIYVCINPDAHSIDGLDDTFFGEKIAEKAMLPSELILNLKNADEMEEYLCKRKQRAAPSR